MEGVADHVEDGSVELLEVGDGHPTGVTPPHFPFDSFKVVDAFVAAGDSCPLEKLRHVSGGGSGGGGDYKSADSAPVPVEVMVDLGLFHVPDVESGVDEDGESVLSGPDTEGDIFSDWFVPYESFFVPGERVVGVGGLYFFEYGSVDEDAGTAGGSHFDDFAYRVAFLADQVDGASPVGVFRPHGGEGPGFSSQHVAVAGDDGSVLGVGYRYE